MIRFPCRCKRPLAVPDDQAGGTVQCRHCGRLNDVPTIEEADHIDADGSYKLDDDRPAADGLTAAHRRRQTTSLLRAGGRDERGDSRDLRPTVAEFLRTGAPTDANLDADGLVPDRPKYDPLTGELVRPLDIRRDEPPKPPTPAGPLKVEPIDDDDVDGLEEVASAFAAKRAAPTPVPTPRIDRSPNGRPGASLTYANRQTDPTPHVPPSRVPIELFKTQNVVVLGFILLGQLLLLFLVGGLPLPMMVLATPVIVVLALVLIGHFGNVVEETGPLERDELPTPMRGLSFGDDIWSPAVHTMGATFACFLPALLVGAYAASFDPVFRGNNGPRPPIDVEYLQAIALALAAVGSVLFPAALMTATTAGSFLLNLAPHRLIGTARACGLSYLTSLGLLAATVVVYAIGVRGTIGRSRLPFGLAVPGRLGEIVEYAVGLPVIVVGVYLAHLFCWHLGLLYRANHASFPWLFQRWEPTRTDSMKELERRRVATRAKAAEALRDRQSSQIAGIPTVKRAPQRVPPVD